VIRLSTRFRAKFATAAVLVAAGLLTNCASASTGDATSVAGTVASTTPKALTLTVMKQYPHDSTCFVEGFQWTPTVSGGGFYESCGQTGASTMQVTNLKGKVLQKVAVPDVFAEGTVRLGERLFQLTWRERIVFVRNPKTLAIIEKRSLPTEITEGWGMTTIGNELVISDGTSRIYFVDPKAWNVTHTISVTVAGVPIDQLNELEFINGQLWANVWRTERIVVIDPATGQVSANVSLSGLRPSSTTSNGESVANGIAYDPKTKRIFVTGKNWPVVFQVVTRAI
jgi:glutaminyl-peptide cyclotransferase